MDGIASLPGKLNRRHRLVLFLTLVAAAVALSFEASLQQTLAVGLFGLAAAWVLGSDSRAVHIFVLTTGVILGLAPVAVDWHDHRKRQAEYTKEVESFRQRIPELARRYPVVVIGGGEWELDAPEPQQTDWFAVNARQVFSVQNVREAATVLGKAGYRGPELDAALKALADAERINPVSGQNDGFVPDNSFGHSARNPKPVAEDDEYTYDDPIIEVEFPILSPSRTKTTEHKPSAPRPQQPMNQYTDAQLKDGTILRFRGQLTPEQIRIKVAAYRASHTQSIVHTDPNQSVVLSIPAEDKSRKVAKGFLAPIPAWHEEALQAGVATWVVPIHEKPGTEPEPWSFSRLLREEGWAFIPGLVLAGLGVLLTCFVRPSPNTVVR